MKKMKLASKIMLFLMLDIVVILGAIFGYLYLNERNRASSQAVSTAQSIARENGALVERQLVAGLDTTRALVQALGGFQDYPAEVRRDVANSMIKQVAQNNPDWVGVWAIFQPGALDGLDAQYAGRPGYSASGLFDSYWYWEDGALKHTVAPVDSDLQQDYYRLAYDSGTETVLEPYVDTSTGKDILMTSFAVPIHDGSGKVVGVAGMDMTLDQLGKLSFSKGEYPSTAFALISNAGQYVVNPDSALVGKNLQDAAADKDAVQPVLAAVRAGEVSESVRLSPLTGVVSYNTFMPVTLGSTGTPWSAEVAIPEREIMAGATRDGILMLIALIVTMLSLLLAIWVTVQLVINRRLKQLMGLADRQAQGDFSQDLGTPYTDELGMLFHSLGAVNSSMNGLLANLKCAAEQVDAGARQISDSAIALAQGATEQASSIEQLTASMEQVASQTRVNAENANQANQLAEKAQQDAEGGNGQMVKLLTAMDDINKSSAGISGIIKVIDDIAFQTNILALNAAVEAARAGEHGKGFAVVAEEVRSLAAKSAQAASQITRMIEESIQKVTSGGNIAGETARALDRIVQEIGGAARLVSGIHVASGEQATAIQQINQGILQVSQVVQANSATSQETAAASEELTGQADNLLRQAAQFKLREAD